MAERPPTTPEDPDRRTPGRWPPNWVDPLPARTPRWVKVFGAVAALVVLLVAVMLLTGHGPGRHMPR
jgi:hypothetical protein